jgi:dihydrofolate reductase
MFAPAWSTRTAEEDPGAPFFNDTSKYVVSSTLSSVDWSNSTLLGGYDPAAIRQLKADVAGTIYMSGSATLVRALLQDGLVDELHLFMYPVTLGSGLRLFTESMPGHKLSLRESETYSNGVVHLSYAPA